MNPSIGLIIFLLLASPSQAKTNASEICVKGEQIRLADVESNAQLKANLTRFMNGVFYEEGKVYVRELTGERKNPAACRGFFDRSIDLVKCEKYKAAGVSRLQVRNGILEYQADGRSKDRPVNLALTRLCSDGTGMAFDFVYDRKIAIVQVGPWLYSVRVYRQDERLLTDIEALVMKTGEKVAINKTPIGVGELKVEPIKDN